MRALMVGFVGLVASGVALLGAPPAMAQSVGYVTGLPGPDPAGHGGMNGWGPAFRPETTFYQPGTPLTPGEIAGRAYRARTGHPVYDPCTGLAWGLSSSPCERGSYHYYPNGYYAPEYTYLPRHYRHKRVARVPHPAPKRVAKR
jgi:hypothetical protein